MAGITAPPDNFEPAGTTIAADGWFPAVETESVRQTIRLGDGVVTQPRLIAAIEGAMISALRALSAWRAVQVLDGHAQLADITAQTINERNQAEAIWERIIRFFAAAELADIHTDISATEEAIDRAEEKRLTADDYRRMAYHAVADLQSLGTQGGEAVPAVPRNRVSLL